MSFDFFATFFFIWATMVFCVVHAWYAKNVLVPYLAGGTLFFMLGGTFLCSHGYLWPGISGLSLGALGAFGVIYMSWEDYDHPDWPYVLGYWIFIVLLAIGIAALMSCTRVGIKVTEEQLGAFQRGRTTYYDVVASLGKPTASTLHHDGTRQAVYVYSQSQLKAINFVPIAAMFAQGATSETTTVTLEFDARSILTSYAANQGQTTIGTGIQSGGRQ